MAGRRLELEASPRQTVRALKAMISEGWKIPPPCQVLVHDTSVLDDTTALVSVTHAAAASLTVTLVISMDNVCRHLLNDADLSVRLHALDALLEMAEGDDVRTVTTLCACLRDTDETLRERATEALGQRAWGSERAISTLSGLLEDAEAPVKVAALGALVRTAGRGDRCAVAAVRPLLEDASCLVRGAAVRALGHLTEEGDGDTIATMSMLLEDPYDDVRAGTEEALRQHFELGDDRYTSAAHWLLDHPGVNVRQYAQSWPSSGRARTAGQLDGALKARGADQRAPAKLDNLYL